MIDTIRFKIPLTPEEFALIRSKSSELIKRNNETGEILLRVLSKDLNLGSYDRKVNLFLYVNDNTSLYLELSLPKFYYGNNIYLLYPDKLTKCMSLLQHSLRQYFGSFPVLDNAEIQRLDLCYAWKFPTQDMAETVLSVLRAFKYGRKRPMEYETTVMRKGSDYSSKFYLKNDEFFKHDFKILHRTPKYFELAYNLLELSQGVLRFEVTLRKRQLSREFCKNVIKLADLTPDKVQEILINHLNKFMRYRVKKLMTSNETLSLLLSKFPKAKALHLWEFYEIYHDKNPQKRRLLETKFNRQTIWRTLRDISLAGVGLPNGAIDEQLDLNIPSEYAVNFSDSFDSTGCGNTRAE